MATDETENKLEAKGNEQAEFKPSDTTVRLPKSEEIKAALAANPDVFASIADLKIPNADKIEPFQIVDEGKTIASTRKIEHAIFDSFSQGLQALPENITPELLAKYQIDYIQRKVSEVEKESTMAAPSEQSLLYGHVEKTNNDFWERMAGTLIGTVQGLGNVAVNLANIADFCAYCIIGDRQRGSAMIMKFGESIGETALSGVKLFQAADKYLYDVGFEGNYFKPFQDISLVAQVLNHEWQNLPPREQERRKAEFISQLLADGFIGTTGAQAIGKAGSLTKMLDAVAENIDKAVIKSKDKFKKSAKLISNLVDELVQPVGDTGTGVKIKMPKSNELANYMEDGSSRAYRGDDDFFAKVNKFGKAKSYINEKGDLVPPDIGGLYQGKPVDAIQHLCDNFYPNAKQHSPFTSLSSSGEVTLHYGPNKMTVNLKGLRDEIQKGLCPGTEIIEHDELLKIIANSSYEPYTKSLAERFALADKEILVKGPIPARFLELTK